MEPLNAEVPLEKLAVWGEELQINQETTRSDGRLAPGFNDCGESVRRKGRQRIRAAQEDDRKEVFHFGWAGDKLLRDERTSFGEFSQSLCRPSAYLIGAAISS